VTFAAWLWLTRRQSTGLAGPASRELPEWLRLGAVAVALGLALHTTGLAAGSRAGAASLLLAGLVLLWLVAEGRALRQLTRVSLAGYLAFLAVALALFFGPWTGVERIVPEHLQPGLRGLRSDGRVVASRVASWMFAGSPLFGTGFDTFGDFQPLYVERPPFLAYAHNDYAQLFAETGLVGTATLIALLGLLLMAGRRFAIEAVPPERLLEAGPWAALSAIVLHSLFDWNLHIPANALLACLLVALALRSGGAAEAAKNFLSAGPAAGRAAGWQRVALVAASVASLALLARDAGSAAVRRTLAVAIAEARLENNSAAGRPHLAAAIAAGKCAIAWDPSDPRLELLLGQAWLEASEAARLPHSQLEDVPEAESWFTRAKRNSATVRGVPQKPAPSGPAATSSPTDKSARDSDRS